MTFTTVPDQADFSFYFDTGGRRRCYIAPERFYESGTMGDAARLAAQPLRPEMVACPLPSFVDSGHADKEGLLGRCSSGCSCRCRVCCSVLSCLGTLDWSAHPSIDALPLDCCCYFEWLNCSAYIHLWRACVGAGCLLHGLCDCGALHGGPRALRPVKGEDCWLQYCISCQHSKVGILVLTAAFCPLRAAAVIQARRVRPLK